ncbi:MAG: hypothetical protein IID46_06645 [Planctomycetes bacterium]|nr:hypothetical protein [Planctomycetota bacterium]
MQEITRRTFTKQTLGSLLTYSLLETLCANDLFAAEVKPEILQWTTELNTLGLDVKNQKLRQIEWQTAVEELFKKVELAELLRLIDFDRLTKNLKFVDNGARSVRFKFPKVEGLPAEYVFGKQIFALKKGRSVVPHGHNNMSTAFLILKGNLRGRHFDRLEDGKDYYIIQPTIDRTFGPGDYSTVSDYKDNIHWFRAVTEGAFIFNIHVLNVTPGSKLPTGRVYLNPNGEKLAGKLIRAPKLGYQEALKLFG